MNAGRLCQFLAAEMPRWADAVKKSGGEDGLTPPRRLP